MACRAGFGQGIAGGEDLVRPGPHRGGAGSEGHLGTGVHGSQGRGDRRAAPPERAAQRRCGDASDNREGDVGAGGAGRRRRRQTAGLERGDGCESSCEAGPGLRFVEPLVVQEPQAGRALHGGHLHLKGLGGARGAALDRQTTDDDVGADAMVPAATAAAAVDQVDATVTSEPEADGLAPETGPETESRDVGGEMQTFLSVACSAGFAQGITEVKVSSGRVPAEKAVSVRVHRPQ